jgi:HSP20 family protein
MTMLRMIPSRELHAVHDEVNRLLSGDAGWVPPVDVHEDEAGYTLHMDLPGIQVDDVKIRAFDGMLTIEGERKSVRPADANSALRLSERFNGSFLRRFSLRSPIDAANIQATYVNGVLEVKVPRAETAKPREIKIAIA